MAQRRLLKLDEIESATHSFLWHASNELVAKTPTISRHLASRLVQTVPEDGMSAFAQRMHCTGCGALMQTAKVRLRKTRARSKDRNRVLRTCPACDKVNKNEGVPRGMRVEPDCQDDIQQLRRKQTKRKKRKEDGKETQKDPSIAMTPIEKKSKTSKKRRRSKSLESSSRNTSDKKRTGLAASFLFEPL